jgi:hypothetical protein
VVQSLRAMESVGMSSTKAATRRGLLERSVKIETLDDSHLKLTISYIFLSRSSINYVEMT